MSPNDLPEMMADRPLRFGKRSATGCDYFDYNPGRPKLFMMMKFKQLLVLGARLGGRLRLVQTDA
jgi:hypothetical protein